MGLTFVIPGNGTQALAQAINQNNVDPEVAYGYPLNGRAIRMFYGSIHDILSYPCEVRQIISEFKSSRWPPPSKDGDPDLIEAASLSVHGTDEQYIENVHLEPYASEGFFWNVLYKEHYCKLFRKAEAFVKETGEADDVIVFIRCRKNLLSTTLLVILSFIAVAALTPVNTKIPPFHDIIVKYLRLFIIDLRKMPLRLPSAMHEEGSSAY
jgi:hypothetical protein